ncbi:sphingomyelin phosphodiesterase [Scheffersomyces amazonensis]|uniref:sphingomyelin phosphodiesterase n=1 Tax=Scheffersomyces amazonensis TaxID=1078765 RepID=UPI00315D5248
MKFSTIVLALSSVVTLAAGHTVPGLNQLTKLNKRATTNPIDSIYNDLSDVETDFINDHITNLTSFNGTKCNACKNKIKYGQTLLNEYPDQSHLVSLLLYKYCLVSNNNTESKCDNTDFFVTTNSDNYENFNTSSTSGVTSVGSVNFYDNDFLHLLKNFNVSSDLDLTYYCYFKGSTCDLPETPDVNELYGVNTWYPAKKPEYSVEPAYTNNTERFNVLHITDFHLQQYYQVGTESNCTSTPCCLKTSVAGTLPGKNYNFTDYYTSLDPNNKNYGISFYPDAYYDENDNYHTGEYYDFPAHRGWNFESLPATSFGGYLCDIPELLFNNTMKYVSQAHADKDFEFVVFTGDLVSHDLLNCDPQMTKDEEIISFNIMKHYLKDIPVFPTLGNHDTFPYGQLAPLHFDANNSYNWNEVLMNNLWNQLGWLAGTNVSTLNEHYSGFSYVTPRGLKVISLNSNAYYQKNLWSYIDLSTNGDLFGQWQFLIDELVASEEIGQRVWIMAHIPNGDSDALPLQSRIFGQIVERFSPYTIANIFYGHTHQDQFHILHSSNTTSGDTAAADIVNMAWVLQSVTSIQYLNPSWRYYEVENESFNIMNSYNYYTKLNETFTNSGAEPNWNFEYSARDLYDPNSTWPLSSPLNATFWNDYVLQKVANQSDVEFNQLYADLQYRYSPGTPNCKNGTEVSKACYNGNFCVLSNFYSDDYINCQI